MDMDEPSKANGAGSGGAVVAAGIGGAGTMNVSAAASGRGAGGAAGTSPPMSAAGTNGNAAASGGRGMPAPMNDTTLRGKLIDLYRRPVVGATLHIDDKIAIKTATTDASGKFTVEGVGATYDVAFKFETASEGEPTTYAWLFEGVSRRDPTLQVYRSADFQRGQLTLRASGVTFPLQGDRNILAGFSSPDGDYFQPLTEAETVVNPSWLGPPELSSGTVHAMLRRTAPASGLITLEVLAYDSKPVTLSNRVPTQVALDFSGPSLPMGTIAGRANVPGEGPRTNWVRMRWRDNAFLPISEETPGPDSFSYFVPSVPDASLMFVAIRGTVGSRPLALGIADDLSVGKSDIQVDVPAWSSLTAPADTKSNVDESTLFQWRNEAKISMFVANESEGNDVMYVVTAAKEAHLAMVPKVPYTPRAGATFEWFVTTHGDFASMDEATGPDGFISAYSYAQVHGPRRGPGSFTSSASRTFTTPL